MSDIITMGIDVGSTASKCIVLKNGKDIIGKALIPVGAGTSGPDRVVKEIVETTGIKIEDMNNYGCSLVWGHPQGPTGARLIIVLFEELVLLGGGYGLFDGCAAGDTAAGVVVKVDTN